MGKGQLTRPILPPRGLVLKHSPLVRVVTQIRWPQFADFDLEGTAKALGLSLAESYPILTQERETEITITPNGAHQQPGGMLHRFSSVDSSWTVTIGANFLALDTNAYVSHEDFIARLEIVAESLTRVAPIRVWDRVGYRYTNRISEPADMARLREFFKPEVLGSVALDRSSQLVHSISEAVYQEGASRLLVRSAHLPPQGTIDPTIPGLNTTTWFLDLDAFDESRTEFTVENVAAKASTLAQIAFTYFQEAVTEEFKERFG